VQRRDDLERFEFMMGAERGRLAVTLDMLTDALILIGQHGVYCASTRNPSKPALDLETVLSEINGAKELIQSVMEQLGSRARAWHSRKRRRSSPAIIWMPVRLSMTRSAGSAFLPRSLVSRQTKTPE